MAVRIITVIVKDSDGYALKGYKVNLYQGPVVMTNEKGEANLSVESSSVSIYVGGRTEYSGLVQYCDNPLYVTRD